jgi:hypothetical protein
MEITAKYVSIARYVLANIVAEPPSFAGGRTIVYNGKGALFLLARARAKTNESLASICMRIWHET